MIKKYTVDRIDYFIDQYGSGIARGVGNIECAETEGDGVEIKERYNPKYAAWKKELDDIKINHPICKPMGFFEFYRNEINKLKERITK